MPINTCDWRDAPDQQSLLNSDQQLLVSVLSSHSAHELCIQPPLPQLCLVCSHFLHTDHLCLVCSHCFLHQIICDIHWAFGMVIARSLWMLYPRIVTSRAYLSLYIISSYHSWSNTNHTFSPLGHLKSLVFSMGWYHTLTQSMVTSITFSRLYVFS
jgi:hypothetical protein